MSATSKDYLQNWIQITHMDCNTETVDEGLKHVYPQGVLLLKKIELAIRGVEYGIDMLWRIGRVNTEGDIGQVV
jgi:hypothetical protein